MMCGNVRFAIVARRSESLPWRQKAKALSPKRSRRGYKEDMEIEALRAELEQLFDLDELLRLSERLLALSPQDIGGETAKGSFVRARTEHCSKAHALEAVCDAVIATKPEASDALRRTANTGIPALALNPGDSFGVYEVERALGEGALGAVYVTRRDGQAMRLKVLHPVSAYDERGLW